MSYTQEDWNYLRSQDEVLRDGVCIAHHLLGLVQDLMENKSISGFSENAGSG